MLRLYAVFHCNLAFSMVPYDHFPTIIRRCYWPVLSLAEKGHPVGIEMNAWTLQEVGRIDPAFVEKLRVLMEDGRCELIGSGFSQAIFPLIPAEVNRWNLEAGGEHYRKIAGRTPEVALVNEQTWSRGIADLYAEAGYTSVIMDWNNAHQHNRYPAGYRYRPQRAKGVEHEIDLLWSDSIAFQKLQRCVHGELAEDEYLDYLFSHHSPDEERAFPIYTNDAEVFDYRPGSADLPPEGEFARLERLIERILRDGRASLMLPGKVVGHFRKEGGAGAFNTVSLESAETPVVCKKQGKYNPLRWAATGRDTVHINTECYRALENIRKIEEAGGAPEAVLKRFKETLCLLWGSDFRTHTIDEKFAFFHSRLGWLKEETARCMERHARLRSLSAGRGAVSLPVIDGNLARKGTGCADPDNCCGRTEGPHECSCGPAPAADAGTGAEGAEVRVTRGDLSLSVLTPEVEVEFLLNKGGAIRSLRFPNVSDERLIGTLEHGHYDDMRLGADFFSTHLIHTTREGRKTTDLAPLEPDVMEEDGSVAVSMKIPLSFGTLWKTFTVFTEEPRIDVKYKIKVTGLNASSLRLGIFTFDPSAFDRESLFFESTNGGSAPERFMLKGRAVGHDEPVSQSVSASSCLGATDGVVRIGDAGKTVEISTDRRRLATVPLLRYMDLDGTFFLRLYHSAGEVDDTAWWVWRGYNEASFTVTARRNGG